MGLFWALNARCAPFVGLFWATRKTFFLPIFGLISHAEIGDHLLAEKGPPFSCNGPPTMWWSLQLNGGALHSMVGSLTSGDPPPYSWEGVCSQVVEPCSQLVELCSLAGAARVGDPMVAVQPDGGALQPCRTRGPMEPCSQMVEPCNWVRI